VVGNTKLWNTKIHEDLEELDEHDDAKTTKARRTNDAERGCFALTSHRRRSAR
jgi:hypothetical protein